MFVSGIPVIVSHFALKDSTTRHFPVSKNRSARIHKKLVKRFGGVFVKEPAAYQTPQGLIIHPVLYAELKRQVEPVRDVYAARNPQSFFPNFR